MFEHVYSTLSSADGVEVTDRLVSAGITGAISTFLAEDGLHILCSADRTTVDAALSGWTPTAQRGSYVSPLPDAVRLHTQHLRDYLAAAAPTDAETVHVVKDLIRAVFYLNSRLENE